MHLFGASLQVIKLAGAAGALHFKRFVFEFFDLRELTLKARDVCKSAIDAGETDVGDFIQYAQTLHNHFAYPCR